MALLEPKCQFQFVLVSSCSLARPNLVLVLSSSQKFGIYLVLVPSRPEDELGRGPSQDDSSRPTDPWSVQRRPHWSRTVLTRPVSSPPQSNEPPQSTVFQSLSSLLMKYLLTVSCSIVDPGMGIHIDTITENDIEIISKLSCLKASERHLFIKVGGISSMFIWSEIRLGT